MQAARQEGDAPPQEWRFWLAQTLFWTVIGVLQWQVLIPGLQPNADTLGTMFVVSIRVLTGSLVSTVVRLGYIHLVRQPWPLRRIPARASLMLVGGALVECLLFQLARFGLGAMGWWPASYPPVAFAMFIFHRIDVLTVWSLLFFGFFQVERLTSAELRAAEAESALRVNELNRLEAQLQPHFLFNALTAILACRHNPDAVAQVTTGLSEHLRYCLSRQGLIEPLGREIDALQQYLHVQRARFGPGLECTIDCTPEAREVSVPSMLVTPLLENALKHGAATSPGPLRITVDCRVVAGTLRVTVTNTGTWVEPGSRGRVGTGLANLRGRLLLHEWDQAELTHAVDDGVVRFCFRLPLSPTLTIGPQETWR